MKPRERLIQATAELLQTQGYRNTGLNQILQHSQVPKGSLYHYFPGGKDALVVAAIEHAAAQVGNGLGAALSQSLGATPASPLAAAPLAEVLTDYFAAQLLESDYRKGCPVATVALEEAGHNPAIQQACAAAYATWLQQLAAIATATQHREPEAIAEQALALIEGALVLSRAQRSITPLQRIQPLLQHLFRKTSP